VSPKPARPWRDRVLDILEASSEARGFVAGMTYTDFAADPKTLKAVLANLAIIGEAVSHIPDRVRAARPSVPWEKIQATRNIVVHVYFAVNPRIVWDTVQNDLSALEQELSALLAQNDDEQ
jgi:uncharacterized protein with HEPN domain